MWCQGLEPVDQSKSMKVLLPPIDVLMVPVSKPLGIKLLSQIRSGMRIC